MAKSLVKNWIHLIFGTKYRHPLIDPAIEHKVHQLLVTKIMEQNCFMDTINGMPDHIHILFLLHPMKSLSEVVKSIKGASAYIINDEDWILEKFAWQKGYAAYSVSESQVDKVRLYIQNQKEHHRKKSFDKEWNQYIKLHGMMTD